MSNSISLDGSLVNHIVFSAMTGEQAKDTGVKAVYLKTTQSHKKGDVVNYDESFLNHRQLKERGFLKIMDEETKVTGPEETKKTKKPKSRVIKND